MSFPFNPFSIIKNRGKRKLDIILLIIFPILATVLSLAFETNYLISTILFFGLPAAWLSWRNKHAAARAFLLTAVASLPFIFAVDYLAILNGSWHIPQSVFPARFFGVVPYEDFLWGFLLIYCIIIFYYLLFKTAVVSHQVRLFLDRSIFIPSTKHDLSDTFSEVIVQIREDRRLFFIGNFFI